MYITPEQLLRIAPGVGPAAGMYVAALNSAMDRFLINTPKRAAHFLAQVVHESGQLARFREDLNYSATRLRGVWPKRFLTIQIAQLYARKPEAIANYVYANRMGNGDERSGDGWRYRGAGWIQITGRKNHQEVAGALHVLADVGDWMSTVNGAALSAAWFWWKSGCNRWADVGNVDAISDLINIGHRTERVGDSVGYDARQNLTKHCLAVLS
ncbi:glycoside hydrolase family 19 protein [Pseudoduganella sp. SL102]|uniref:glycoside hydrolase family 19 protein n=1 Tax=Pseudoduganella sp. SL102 TaxID=2995154 RepID=UPI00248C0B39|nr:glycoside hydrolase family 19 protein [Pseudoduganella sp. SL102]WBS00215.1 glycoside hydrolase family 19 protein [Pseudoduganella sp. SL102]